MSKHIKPTYVPDTHLLEAALSSFKQVAGLRIEIEQVQTVTPPTHLEAELVIGSRGSEHRFIVETKQTVDRYATLEQLKTKFAALKEKGILVVPHLTEALAEECRRLDLSYIDAAGNAYVNEPGLFIFIQGRHLTTADRLALLAKTRSLTPATLKILFVLLSHPDTYLNATYRDVVRASGASLGAVGPVVSDLLERNLIRRDRLTGERSFIDPMELVDEFALNYSNKLKPKLRTFRFGSPSTDWWQNVDLKRYDAAWGSEVAAALLTRYLKPQTMTIYLPIGPQHAAISKLIIDHRLQADPFGEIEIVQKFWNFDSPDPRQDCVPPLLIYADLMSNRDERNRETAEIIRRGHIEPLYA